MFTLFTRKGRTGEKKILDLASGSSDTTLVGPTTVEIADLRELARQTVAKIDLIESEMIERPAPKRRDGGTGLPEGIGEASILFGNGQSGEAAATLAAAIARLDGAPGERYARRILLDVLYVAGERARFERAAGEFAERFGVAAPRWESAFSGTHRGGASSAAAGAMRHGSLDLVRLEGDVIGRHAGPVGSVPDASAAAPCVVLDCRRLRRLDFDAADEIVSRVRALRAAGRKVFFVEPSFVVEALLIVLGVQRVAAIRRRKI